MIFNMISSGGGASAPRFGIATCSPTVPYSTKSLSFNGLLGEPQAFCVILVPKGKKTSIYIELNRDNYDHYYISHFVYDGVEISTAVASRWASGLFRLYAYGNGYNAENNAYSFVYSNGTLTISINSTLINDGSFYSGDSYMQYELLYIY